ncbi:MAG TPA: hypothetical protein VIK02_01615 [Candidatus Anoxymicrobiaceae bacterium]
MAEEEPGRGTRHSGSRRLVIGSSVISLLGITFGSCLIVAGSALTWRSDHILGIYNQSGWKFTNIAGGDGKITMALGALMAVGFILGVVLQNKVPYLIALVADIIVGALSLYELIYLFTRQGVIGPGSGLYMVLGGSIAGGLCALGGYLMMAESRADDEEPTAHAEASGAA